MNIQFCPACGVAIEGDTVLFSCGGSGTRERLFARVCQYAKKQGCINKGTGLKSFTEKDFYATNAIRKELEEKYYKSINNNYTLD
jgi:hypothetical protein